MNSDKKTIFFIRPSEIAQPWAAALLRRGKLGRNCLRIYDNRATIPAPGAGDGQVANKTGIMIQSALGT